MSNTELQQNSIQNKVVKSRVKRVFNAYSDPGHGWVKVPYSLLSELRITPYISGCSYQRGEFIYLEEDCDLDLFVKAYTAYYGFKPTFKCHWTNKRSKIRNYHSFIGF